MTKSKKIKWLPVISFCCVLLLFFSFGTLVNVKVGISLIVIIVTASGVFSAFFPDHLKHLMNLWSEKILTESHWIIVAISAGLAIVFLFIIGREYRVDIVKIKKNE